MRFIRRLLSTLRAPRPSYADEVLFAGWVELPPAFREIMARR
jgi:hypothetical protein